MAYAIRFSKRARAAYDAAAETYPGQYVSDMQGWFAELAERAERRDRSFTVDFGGIIEAADAATEASGTSWGLSRRRFAWAGLRERIRALVVLFRGRLPWELRAASRHFTVVGAFTCETFVFFEIDHVT
ncbi:MAG: hypothetical protein C0501_28355, partial [Isosphaera sp.]|nr:hypothetical protein [Isosphaera sp.]